MTKPRVLFVSQEIEPYSPNSIMADFGRYLPQYIMEHGKEIRIFMPRFANVNERKNQLHEVIRLSGLNIVIDDTDHPLIIKVASISSVRMQIYFIDNEDYFVGKGDIRDENGVFKPDNDERTIFFARGVLETIKNLSWKPDIIQCSGWFSMLLPFYIKRTDYRDNPFFMESKVIVTLCDDEFGETMAENMAKKLKTDGGTQKDWKFYKEPTYVNIMKAAINYSDGVILASANVNQELIDYAKDCKKDIIPFTPYKNEYFQSINEYFDSIAPKEDD
ncbi:MAG: glycogen/starch synthase [Bacteroidales bacterium]|nr:glycogen/starch synthase [Bacteroidales bacterium]MBQ9311594.1 glycogen/starch synthase [Bacteroidales bacterium]